MSKVKPFLFMLGKGGIIVLQTAVFFVGVFVSDAILFFASLQSNSRLLCGKVITINFV